MNNPRSKRNRKRSLKILFCLAIAQSKLHSLIAVNFHADDGYAMGLITEERPLWFTFPQTSVE
jgi:hypothetical protein